MIELYLNDKLAYFDDSKQIKITKENPYFTQSGSYTLDVILPLSIPENRDIFNNVNRFEVSKKPLSLSAKLFADNHLILYGTAIVTKIKEEEITIQLLGGNSEVNFLSKNGNLYIDEIKYFGEEYEFTFNFYSHGTEWNVHSQTAYGDEYCVYVPVYDETNDRVENATCMHYGNKQMSNSLDKDDVGTYTYASAPMPNLIHTIRRVIWNLGYKIKKNDFDKKPWTNIYIANARRCNNHKDALPHWTVAEFFNELCKFFNCTISFDEQEKSVSIISNLTYFDKEVQVFKPFDEYEVELSKEDEEKNTSIGSSNIEYDVSDSPSHAYDVLSDEILNTFEIKEYGSVYAMNDALNAMDDVTKRKYIFKYQEEYYVWAEIDGSWGLKEVNQFGRLIRNEDVKSSMELKICPVGITMDQDAVYYEDVDNNMNILYCDFKEVWRRKVPMLSMENPRGDAVTKETACVWYGIIGEEEVSKGNSPEDRMQVFFLADNIQYINGVGQQYQQMRYPYPMPFTDSADKLFKMPADMPQNWRDTWSMNLRSKSQWTVGSLHDNNYIINTQAEIMIDFESHIIPSVDKIFLFNNKRYVCKKLEYSLQNGKMVPIIRGYFYEMIGS